MDRARWLTYVLDFTLCWPSISLALYSLNLSPTLIAKHTFVFMMIAASVLVGLRLPEKHEHLAPMDSAVMVLVATSMMTLGYWPLLYVLNFLNPQVPMKVLITSWLLASFLLMARRFLVMAYDACQHMLTFGLLSQHKPALILVGHADEAASVIRRVKEQKLAYKILGIIEDSLASPTLGDTIQGTRVLGRIHEMGQILAQKTLPAQTQMILLPSLWQTRRLTSVWKACAPLGLSLHRIGIDPDTQAAFFKPLVIEDIIAKNVPLESEAGDIRAILHLRTIFVTGAGGYLADHLLAQLAKLSPARVILLDNNETCLNQASYMMKIKAPHILQNCVLADIRDRRRMDDLFALYRPDVVFQCAGLKHTGIAEDNPIEAISSQVLGTFHVAEACRRNRVHAMVLCSSSSSQTPHDLLAACHRLAEIICQTFDLVDPAFNMTRFLPLRLPNVTSTPGSVIDLFRHKLSLSEPLPVSHPRCERTFIVPQDATNLMLHSLLNLEEEGSGKIYFTDIGEKLKIIDLAQLMIQLQPSDSRVTISGLPAWESLGHASETYRQDSEATSSPFLKAVKTSTPSFESLVKHLHSMKSLCQDMQVDDLLKTLSHLVPEYQPAPRHHIGQDQQMIS